jgi:hypothetical protein
LNKEKLRQITIAALKADEYDFQGCSGLKIDGFSCEKSGNSIACSLTFKDSPNQFTLTIDPSVSYFKDIA